jgi:uncharacterized phage-associated protein
MYEARKICNFLLTRYDTRKHDLTNLRLNKLLYFIHGWSLTSRPHGLIRNHFEAWKLGPVIKPVFDTFKVFGEKQISGLAEHLDYASGEKKPISYEDITQADVETITSVFESYARYTTGELVALTHEVGAPWHVVYTAWANDNRLSPRIPDQLIRAYFLRESGGQKIRGKALH